MSLVELGDYVYPVSGFSNLSNGLVSAKALDDRAGVYTLLEVTRKLSMVDCSCDVYFVFTVQEELGGRGAVVAANAVRPDICFVVDATHAADYPTINPTLIGEVSLGAGCVLSKGANIDNTLFSELRNIATKNSIKYQIEPNPYPAGTDGNWIQISNEGVRTALVSLPCRYMHTPAEIMSVHDIDCAIQLIQLYCRGTQTS